MKKILIIIASLLVLFAMGIFGIWFIFNSGISNETSSTIDRAGMEEQMEDLDKELNELINQ